jgi:hypothetical protein
VTDVVLLLFVLVSNLFWVISCLRLQMRVLRLAARVYRLETEAAEKHRRAFRPFTIERAIRRAERALEED